MFSYYLFVAPLSQLFLWVAVLSFILALCLSPSPPGISHCVGMYLWFMVGGQKGRWYIPTRCQTMTETYIGGKLPKEGATEVHTRREKFRLLPSGKEFVRLHAEKTRRCVSGPGVDAVGLLYCSRWCTFSIYKKTLCVGSKEEVLSSIPVSNTADLNHFAAACMFMLLWMERFLAQCSDSKSMGGGTILLHLPRLGIDSQIPKIYF